jgi:hypothetical protein
MIRDSLSVKFTWSFPVGPETGGFGTEPFGHLLLIGFLFSSMAQCSTTFNLVLGFGLFKQFGNFGFQLLLQLTGMVVTERLVFGCVGLYFSAIQAYRP